MKKVFAVLLAVMMLFAFSTTATARDWYNSPLPGCIGLAELVALVALAEQREEANYTEESWTAFVATLDAARAVVSTFMSAAETPSPSGFGHASLPVIAYGSFVAAAEVPEHVPDDCEKCQAHGALAAAKAGLVREDGAAADPAPGPVEGVSPQTGASDVGTFAFLLGALALAGMFVTRRRD